MGKACSIHMGKRTCIQTKVQLQNGERKDHPEALTVHGRIIFFALHYTSASVRIESWREDEAWITWPLVVFRNFCFWNLYNICLIQGNNLRVTARVWGSVIFVTSCMIVLNPKVIWGSTVLSSLLSSIPTHKPHKL